MSTSAAAARLAGDVSPAAARSAAASRFPTGSVLRLTPTRRRRGRGIRCCFARNLGAGAGGVESGEEFVRFFREAWPYIRGHRGSTFVVVISSEVVSGPHFDGILQVLGFWNYCLCSWVLRILHSYDDLFRGNCV
jgi:amino-acid N-acetyltransferase